MKARISALVSVIWLIVLFVSAVNEANHLSQFLSKFLIVGTLPVIIGWGIRWVLYGTENNDTNN